ncbi:glycosyltransferase [Clostridium aminobutyricum]|uniref:Glycosyltransferase n=1 Tax=Clostridium aminobutyricum TaxID=33953 RepID=A0A939DB88_CLOAM|nr:glycosyltransferase [Clostridium aminobutyricum]MBN7774078.1 glycosyltransferase [Clostridium aminobutyricum]
MNEIMVSICCIAYNQESYIRQTIESFLMQEAKFKYEILIHDDASTDATPLIIKEYQEKYPHLIKPIYQTENQYSKGISVLALNMKRALGKYIAICEGDDFWIDPYKLQKQVEYLESNPDCTLITHAAIMVNHNGHKLRRKIQPYTESRVCNVRDIIMGDGGFFSTNSMMFKSELGKSLPAFYFGLPVGDYPLTIFLSLNGQVYYINEELSAYRIVAKGSLSATNLFNKERAIQVLVKINKMLDEADAYSNERFTDYFKEMKVKRTFYYLLEYDGRAIKNNEECKRFYDKLSRKEQLKSNLKCNLPVIYRIYKKHFMGWV